MVCVKSWLLERFQVKSSFKAKNGISQIWDVTLLKVINALMKRIVEVHPNEEILLVLDEVSSPYKDENHDWSSLKVPPKLTLVIALKPTKKSSFDNAAMILPNLETIRSIKLTRQYRNSENIQNLLRIMSLMLKRTKRFTSILPEIFSVQKGDEIPGDIVEWFALKGDPRGVSNSKNVLC